MLKRIIVAGLLGGVVLFVWTFFANGILGFNSKINMKQVPQERQVYEVLKANIVEPGRYVCNLELTSERRFPEGEPVFSILYGGGGHEFAGLLMLVKLVIFFSAPMIGAWMLSQVSGRVLVSYPRKVLFFVAIGLLIAVFTDLKNFGFGSYPLKDAVLLAIYRVITWTLVSLVVAWRMRPEPGTE